MTPKKIYISGKMSGLDKKDYTKIFFDKEWELRKIYPDTEIVNPVVLGYQLEKALKRTPEYHEYLRDDIWHLSNCDAIYMMKNYENSNGAIAELAFAKACCFEIMYE